MTAFYFVSVALLLGAFILALNFALDALAKREDQSLLFSHATLARSMVLTSPECATRTVNAMTTRGSSALEPHAYIRILDGERNVLAATPAMDRVAPLHALSVPPGRDPVFDEGRTAAGDVIRSISVWVDGNEPGRRWLLQIAVDESADVRFGNALRWNIAVILVVGLLLAAVLSGWVARSALRPLTALTTAATGVTASRLRARLDTAGWPAELAQLADAFDAMLARLEDSFERLSQFSANLSHELRTPIHNLRGEAEVALAQASTVGDYRAVIESGLEELERLSRLIDNLLFLAHAESSEIKIGSEELDVPREVAAVIEFHDAQADERGVTLHQSGVGRVRSDSVLFRRMISNLLSNALRHTPAGGRIDVAVERHPDGRLEIRVTDTGAGIPAEHLARIYDRFYRVPPARDEASGHTGFGLGLAIVKSIMALHGGEISVESQVGRGTSVRLVFPASRAA